MAIDGHAKGFNYCTGSAEESVTAATTAAEESRQRMLKTEGQAGNSSFSTSATAAASTTVPHQTATTAASSGGKPPKAPRPGGTQDSDASSSGQAGGAGQQKGNVGQGQDGRAGAAGRGTPDGDDDPYRPMGWRVSLNKSRTPAWHRPLLAVYLNHALGIMHYFGMNHMVRSAQLSFAESTGQRLGVLLLLLLVDIVACTTAVPVAPYDSG